MHHSEQVDMDIEIVKEYHRKCHNYTYPNKHAEIVQRLDDLANHRNA